MESILARALEYTLKYWLKFFSRDQFKLQGRTVQFSNLDMDGDALHSSMGLPPAIHVTTARVGKLEIVLPSVSNVQVEPIVVQIDNLDLVLEENAELDARSSPSRGSYGCGFLFSMIYKEGNKNHRREQESQDKLVIGVPSTVGGSNNSHSRRIR